MRLLSIQITRINNIAAKEFVTNKMALQILYIVRINLLFCPNKIDIVSLNEVVINDIHFV